jgi:hypothetical protein
VDPYFDAPTFGQVVSSTQEASIRVLCGRHAKEVSECALKFATETGTKAIVKKSKDLHDRLIFIDDQICWIFGSSIKDGGKKPTYLIPAAPEITAKKIEIYRNIWTNSASPI